MPASKHTVWEFLEGIYKLNFYRYHKTALPSKIIYIPTKNITSQYPLPYSNPNLELLYFYIFDNLDGNDLICFPLIISEVDFFFPFSWFTGFFPVNCPFISFACYSIKVLYLFLLLGVLYHSFHPVIFIFYFERGSR